MGTELTGYAYTVFVMVRQQTHTNRTNICWQHRGKFGWWAHKCSYKIDVIFKDSIPNKNKNKAGKANTKQVLAAFHAMSKTMVKCPDD